MIYQNPKQMMLESDIDIFDFENDPMTSMLETYDMDTYVLTEGSIKDIFERVKKVIQSVINFIAQNLHIFFKKIKEKFKEFSYDDKVKLGITNLKRAGAKIQVYYNYRTDTFNRFINETASKCNYNMAEYIDILNRISHGDENEFEKIKKMDNQTEFYKSCPKFIEYKNVKKSLMNRYPKEDYVITDADKFINDVNIIKNQVDEADKVYNSTCKELDNLLSASTAIFRKIMSKSDNELRNLGALSVLTKFSSFIHDKSFLIMDMANFMRNILFKITFVANQVNGILRTNYNTRINPGQVFNVGSPEDSAKNESTIFESVRFLNA